MKKLFWLLVPLVIFLVGCQVKKNNTSQENSSVKEESSSLTSTTTTTETQPTEIIPTIFFHGYAGGRGSFSSMMTRIENNHDAHLGAVLKVDPQGNVYPESWGEFQGKDMVQVLFEDSKNNEWNQAQWVENVLTYLSNKGIKEVNLVGHSMGGIDIVRFLLTFPTPSLKINKIVTMGAPFNEFEVLNDGETMEQMLARGPENESDRYSQLSPLMENFPKEIPWLNIAGLREENNPNDGDGTVPLGSAEALTAEATKNQLLYENQVFTGSEYYHSGLHEEQKVDEVVSDFLWN